MQDITTMVQKLRRPRLLMRAARMGAADYRRELHLPRLLGYGRLPRTSNALLRLMEMERELDHQRRDEAAAYNMNRHLEILIAMVGEFKMHQALYPSA